MHPDPRDIPKLFGSGPGVRSITGPGHEQAECGCTRHRAGGLQFRAIRQPAARTDRTELADQGRSPASGFSVYRSVEADAQACNPLPGDAMANTCTARYASSHRMRAKLAAIMLPWTNAPVSGQMPGRKIRTGVLNWSGKPAPGKPPDPSFATPKPKSAPLKSETPHDIGGHLL